MHEMCLAAFCFLPLLFMFAPGFRSLHRYMIVALYLTYAAQWATKYELPFFVKRNSGVSRLCNSSVSIVEL